MVKQKCKSCKTVFIDTTWVDSCPICRSKNISRWDTIELDNGRTKTVKLT